MPIRLAPGQVPILAYPVCWPRDRGWPAAAVSPSFPGLVPSPLISVVTFSRLQAALAWRAGRLAGGPGP